MPIPSILRSAKNKIGKYTPAQIKARDATSNEQEGPALNALIEIAALSFNPIILDEMLQILTKRLNDDSRNWRHIFKSIKVFEFCVIHGSAHVEEFVRRNIHYFESLKSYQQFKDSRECGAVIRDAANHILCLLSNQNELDHVRDESKNISSAVERKKTMAQSYEYHETRSSDHLEMSDMSSRYSRPKTLCVSEDIKSAYPNSIEEEEVQVQLALALSKEQSIDTIHQPKQNAKSLDDMLLIDFAKFNVDESGPPKAQETAQDFDIFGTSIPESNAQTNNQFGFLANPQSQQTFQQPNINQNYNAQSQNIFNPQPNYGVNTPSPSIFDPQPQMGFGMQTTYNQPQNFGLPLNQGFDAAPNTYFGIKPDNSLGNNSLSLNTSSQNLGSNQSLSSKKAAHVDDPFGFLEEVISSTVSKQPMTMNVKTNYPEEKPNDVSSNNPFL